MRITSLIIYYYYHYIQKFFVNLWTLCFVLQKVPKSFKDWTLLVTAKTSLFENYVTSEGVVSHNVLYHQPLPITRYQVRFYHNNYFE